MTTRIPDKQAALMERLREWAEVLNSQGAVSPAEIMLEAARALSTASLAPACAACEVCRETLNAAERAAGVYGTPATLIDYIEGAQGEALRLVQADATRAEQAQQIARLREALNEALIFFRNYYAQAIPRTVIQDKYDELCAILKGPLPACTVCGNEVRGADGCFTCECPAPAAPHAPPTQ